MKEARSPKIEGRAGDAGGRQALIRRGLGDRAALTDVVPELVLAFRDRPGGMHAAVLRRVIGADPMQG